MFLRPLTSTASSTRAPQTDSANPTVNHTLAGRMCLRCEESRRKPPRRKTQTVCVWRWARTAATESHFIFIITNYESIQNLRRLRHFICPDKLFVWTVWKCLSLFSLLQLWLVRLSALMSSSKVGNVFWNVRRLFTLPFVCAQATQRDTLRSAFGRGEAITIRARRLSEEYLLT